MTTPLPPTPTITTPPPGPVSTTTTSLPPSLLTVTSTVLVPPQAVTITNPAPDQGLHGWAVPIATLVAAAVAGVVLSASEALKRRREDRRQWDKEIRDHCAKAITAADAIVKGGEDVFAERTHRESLPMDVLTAVDAAGPFLGAGAGPGAVGSVIGMLALLRLRKSPVKLRSSGFQFEGFTVRAVDNMNRSGFNAASFCVKDGEYGQALPGRAA